MTRLVRLIPVLFLLASAGCDTSPDPDPDPVDDDDVTDSPDDDDTALLEAVTSVIGPDGGSISLSDGTTLVVPAGAVEEETEFTIEPTDPVETPYDDGRFVRVGTPFLVSPSIGVEPPAVVEYVVPVDELPDGVTSGDVVLVATSIGIAEALSVEEEGDEPATEMGLVHPMWGAASASDDEATFAWASVTPATLQPMVPVTPLGLPGPPPEVPEGAYGGLQIGTDCSSILTLYTGSPPANINSDVALTVPLSAPAWAHYNALPAANQQQFADSVERFLARVCLSTWRAVQYYSNEMGFFPIPRPVPVTVDWASQFRPGISRCIGGSANGQGVNFFFAGDSNVAPCTPPANYPGFSVNWNTAPPAGTPPDQWLDRLDHISVHELFHYVDDWANYLDDNLYGFAGGGGQFHTEGAAVAAQEEVFDDYSSSTSVIEFSGA